MWRIYKRGNGNSRLYSMEPPKCMVDKQFETNVLCICQQIKDLITEDQLDICSLTETWFKPFHIAVKAVVSPGYTMKLIPRANARGGGVAIIFRDSISVTVSKHNTYTSMEYLNCLFKVGLELLRIVTIYRPPPKAESPNVPVFLKEFADLLEYLTLTSGQLLLVGYLNFHFDTPTSAHTKSIIDLLSATHHHQHVNLATHQKGHILDVIITRRDELPIADITCDESVNSDHSTVIFTVPSTQQRLFPVTTTHCCQYLTSMLLQESVIRSIDQRKGVILLLIDLSAAFDTIDHDILLNTLSNTIGVKDRCLSWFAACLQHRQYTVLIAGEQSKPHKLTCGVPKGSVFGPLLFTKTPLASLLKLHGMTYHLYANDTQLFQDFNLSDNTSPEIAARKMERCFANIRQWMKTNMLKLNDDKTEILIIRPKSANQHLLPESVRIGYTNVTPNTHARNLGVIFDCNMSLERHVTNISRTAYYHLHSIGRIRRYLEQGHTTQLVHALVISRIDCCNSLLNGLSVAVVEKL